MGEPALPGQTLLAELSRKAEIYGRSEARSISRKNLASLIAAARLVPVLMAEKDAWRDWDKDDNPTMGELERRLDRIRKAHAATDAALARAGVKMGEKR